MNNVFHQSVAAGLIVALSVLPGIQAIAEGQAETPKVQLTPLRQELQKSYVELFETAPELEYSSQEIQRQRDALKAGEDSCRRTFRGHADGYKREIEAARKSLKVNASTISEAERHNLHCRIQGMELLKSEADVLAGHAIPTAYDNLNAKLDLIQQWPQQHRQARGEIADGSYMQRRWADVKDIGFRDIAKGQQDDVKRGQQAVEEMKRTGLMPPELENKEIQAYVASVAEHVAQNSDLKVPLHVRVLDSREINAFALPGGFVFVERGLLEAADDESELAGVIAHELAHDTARHSAKMMRRATIAGIFYQAAQAAAMILTGGIASIGMYYALQYGFYGLGLVLDLKLLGVNRDYELEADQLGVQYAWKAGYDTSGFVRFFDKMATRMGYVNGVSWFRTHPPFYQRMVQTQREIMFMPKQTERVVQTSAFLKMKRDLAPIAAAAEKEEVGRRSALWTREEGCTAPAKLEYKPGQPIEELCASAPRTVEVNTTQ